MALIPCPECGHKVSTSATACPACAYPLASREQNTKPRTECRVDRSVKATHREEPVSLVEQLENFKRYFATVPEHRMRAAIEGEKDLLVSVSGHYHDGQSDYDILMEMLGTLDELRDAITEVSRRGQGHSIGGLTQQRNIERMRKIVSNIRYRG